MRILLAHNSLYYPSYGGGDKSNRLLMEALAARGHDVRVLARTEKFGPQPQAQFLARVAYLEPVTRDGAVRFRMNGVDVRTLTGSPQLRGYIAAEVDSFDPHVIVTSTDDPAQLLFEIAAKSPRARVVHLVRATLALPFGPDASMVNAARAASLRRADRVAGVSEYVARYVREHGRMHAEYVPISLMEPAGTAACARFDSEWVVMVNPCAVKGIAIFLALADAMPGVAFAAVPTWGTNVRDLAALRVRPNVTAFPPVENMDDLFRRTRVLLVPSVWAEARSRIVVEAMLRGVPVIASDIGGIPEAKLGVPYLLPVNPIRGYRPEVDENMVPVPDVPPQDIGPWQAALGRLIADPEHWAAIARQSRDAALEYVRTLSVEPFESLLFEVVRNPKKPARGLTNDRRRLLALRLQQKATSGPGWFPIIEPGPFRLFCFPHAGGGTLTYRSWRDRVGQITVAPLCLGGREHRIAERAIEDMSELIAALAAEIRPHLDVPFAFFGHSMGAAVAFELTRALRASGERMPGALIVSAARAPQLRENYRPPPDPSEAEFLEELRRLEGVPRELLEHPDALRVLLPALRSDARLYRRYVYLAAPPLEVPIFAYGGSADPNVRPEHVEPWSAQTVSRFVRREFDGGHFYLQTRRDEFLAALATDLADIMPG